MAHACCVHLVGVSVAGEGLEAMHQLLAVVELLLLRVVVVLVLGTCRVPILLPRWPSSRPCVMQSRLCLWLGRCTRLKTTHSLQV